MNKVVAEKVSVGRELRLLSDRAARLAALERAFGTWKGRGGNTKKELRIIRRSWDRPLPKRRSGVKRK